MRILVTGVAGFIGMSVAQRLLARGDSVIGIDNLDAYYSVELKLARIAEIERADTGRFHFIPLDFSQMETLARGLQSQAFDAIVHLGAQPGVRHSIRHPHAYASANLGGHLNILELARGRQVSHMVYASSSSVYGNATRMPLSVDDSVDQPISLYAATKKADELMSEAYAHLYRIPLTGLRFFTVYGPWGRPDMAVWNFTRCICEGIPIDVYNHGEMRRDFTFIDDIVGGVIAALDRAPVDNGLEKAGGSCSAHAIYNIGNNRPEPLLRLIELIEASVGRTAQLRMLPMQDGDVKETYADISAIERDLGYRPTTPIDIGVPRFVAWYKSYHGID